jgi:bifunctional non-homologous end joining protein LigD
VVAFDLIELQADDLRDLPLQQRKQRLAKILARRGEAIDL